MNYFALAKKSFFSILVAIICMVPGISLAAGDFITTWQTTAPNETITLPTNGGGYNYDVDWGDGNSSTGQTGAASHEYALAGTYTVTISGTFPRLAFNFGSEKDKILSIEQWGTQVWDTMGSAFAGCSNLVINAVDAPDLSNVTDMMYALRSTGLTTEDLSGWDTSNVISMVGTFQDTQFNGDISTWDVSSATTLSAMFYGNHVFNQDISTWNTSSVTDMGSMFAYNNAFNQNIGGWDVSNVTNMQSMFYQADSFNQNLTSWDVSSVLNMNSMFEGATSFNGALLWGSKTASVTNMQGMFTQASAFNQDISGWDVSGVTTMAHMFNQASAFNQDLDAWNVSSVTNMSNMFTSAGVFNGAVGSWDVSSVTNMQSMFYGAGSFNQDISAWDTSSVTTMIGMFVSAVAFNQPIGSWNVSNVTNMEGIFYGATGFNQDVSLWDVSSVINMGTMFTGATAFDQNLGAWNPSSATSFAYFLQDVTLSTTNYDALLTGWAARSLQSGINFHAGNSIYSNAAAARQYIIDTFGWTITDGGYVAPAPTPAVSSPSNRGVVSGGGRYVGVPVSKMCPLNQVLTQNLRAGARNGKYDTYTKSVVTEAKILQAHLNRLGFASGKEDGILGMVSNGAIKRLQLSLGTKADGYVGPVTRALLNNSCGKYI
jgi:surface protein